MDVYRVSGKHSERLEVIEQSRDGLVNKGRVILPHGAYWCGLRNGRCKMLARNHHGGFFFLFFFYFFLWWGSKMPVVFMHFGYVRWEGALVSCRGLVCSQ